MRLTHVLIGMMAGWSVSSPTQSPPPSTGDSTVWAGYPTRTLANVTVIDTPLVRNALTFTREHSTDEVWNHVMRSWLYGTLILQGNATLRATVDPEVHALAAIMHDLGFDQTPGSPIVSTDRRFEVDGAIAARDFISRHGTQEDWPERRLQLVWDGIALHGLVSIYAYKEPDVASVGNGVGADFAAPAVFGIPEEAYAAVLREFPKVNFRGSVEQTFIWLCTTKPATTYDTSMQPWGERLVPGYSAVGHRGMDQILEYLGQ